MSKPLFRALCCTTLALGLVFAPLSPAFAGQTVTLDNVTTTDDIFGNGPDDTVGASTGNGGWDGLDLADLLDPNDNTVNFTDGNTAANGRTIYGAFIENGGSIPDTDNVSASGNTVNITDSDVGNVYGANTSSVGSGDADASGNTVTVEESSARVISGGYAGSDSGSATATNNTVTISDGLVVVGGEVYGGRAYSADTGDTIASGNTVTITGGTVNGVISGGWAESASGTATATNNTVTIRGNTNLSAAALYGGFAGAGTGDDRTGNTLNLHSPVTVVSVQNFENWNFYLPSDIEDGETMLTVTETATLGTGAKVNVGIAGGSSPLQVGDTVILIDADTLDGNLADYTANGSGMQGITLKYEFDLDLDDKQLWATVTSVGVNGNLKALTQGRAAGHAFLNQGSDLIYGPGMNGILATTTSKKTLTPFFAAQGGKSKYDTGSHVDVSGVNILTGLAWRQPLDKGSDLLVGAFFEAGWGSYDSYHSFANGEGDVNYYGGGLLARYGAACGAYLDGSLRAGKVETDFSSSDLRDSVGTIAAYDASSSYFGTHLGVGYVLNIAEKTNVDMSARYIWTHQGSDEVRVAGDPVHFKGSDSHRLRLGGRLSHTVNEVFTPYAGAAYEHEFSGKAKASVHGYDIDAAELSGGTGMGELGFSLTSAKDLPLFIDLGVQGYVGTRKGVTGSIRLRYDF